MCWRKQEERMLKRIQKMQEGQVPGEKVENRRDEDASHEGRV